MPIRQYDADRNIQTIKTLNDITAGSPLPVSIPGTLTSTDTVVQGRIGGTNSTPATAPTADTGLNGVIKGLWKDLSDRFLSLVGTTSDAASSTGSLMARLRQIAENPGGGGSSGGGTVSGAVAIQDGATATNKLAVNASGQVSISNFPATQAVSGSVSVSNLPATQAVSGSVSVSNLPATQATSSADIGTTADVAASADTGSFTLIAAIKRFLARFTTYLGIFGTVADVSDTTGTLMARIRATLDRVGSYGDAASTTGSLMAQVRYLGDNMALGYAEGTTQSSPKGTFLLAKGSGTNAGKVYGLTLDSNGYLPVSIPGTINIADYTTPANKLSINSSGFIGVSTLPGIVGGLGDTASSTGSLSAQLRYIGESLNRTTTTTAISTSASGDNTIITGTTGKQIAIATLVFTVSSGASVTLKNGSTAISGAMQITDMSTDHPQPMLLSTGSNFVINVSATANLRGYVIWYLI